MNIKTYSIFLLSIAFVLTGCTKNTYTGESQVAKTTTGATIGAVAGAGIGALSSSKKDRKKGALIGAVSGAAVGGGIGAYMDIQESKLRQKLQNTGVSITRTGDNIILNMPNSITFDTNSASVKPQGIDALTSVALIAAEYQDTTLNIIGHTDSTGSAATNNRLSLERANSVANILTQKGVAYSRVTTYGQGSMQPIASNNTEYGRSQNRRVEIVLSPRS